MLNPSPKLLQAPVAHPSQAQTQVVVSHATLPSAERALHTQLRNEISRAFVGAANLDRSWSLDSQTAYLPAGAMPEAGRLARQGAIRRKSPPSSEPCIVGYVPKAGQQAEAAKHFAQIFLEARAGARAPDGRPGNRPHTLTGAQPDGTPPDGTPPAKVPRKVGPPTAPKPQRIAGFAERVSQGRGTPLAAQREPGQANDVPGDAGTQTAPTAATPHGVRLSDAQRDKSTPGRPV